MRNATNLQRAIATGGWEFECVLIDGDSKSTIGFRRTRIRNGTKPILTEPGFNRIGVNALLSALASDARRWMDQGAVSGRPGNELARRAALVEALAKVMVRHLGETRPTIVAAFASAVSGDPITAASVSTHLRRVGIKSAIRKLGR